MPSKIRMAVSPVQCSDIGFGLFEPLDLIRRHLFVRYQILGTHSEFGEDFIHGNALASVFLQPSFALSYAPAVFISHRLIIRRSGGDGCCNGAEHGFEKSSHSRNLAGRETVYQLVSKDDDETKVTRKTYGKGKEGSEVVLVVIEGGGHTWPGRKPPVSFMGKSATNVSANDLMWEFFEKHRLK